jgi:hypothetical protein
MATPPTPIPRISPESPGAPPVKKSQNILIWILSGCGAVIVLFVLVAILAFRSFVKNNFHVGPNGEVDVSVAGMTMHGGKAQDVGLPIYPGADTVHATGMEMTIPNKQHGPQMMTVSIYSVKDSVEKVDNWYHQNLGAEFIRLDPGQSQATLGDKAFPFPLDSGAISYTCKSGDVNYAVTLHAIMGTTQLKLMRANAPVHQPQ